ncbi:hypothetical protein SAMN04487765_0647 [Tenacibaculum sp. MAR_2010_89]|uniref:hypothetical protein n=1 Tax=Tenacibaculum sp. MAR_2010_89 TaxID=1250198 RepID=UPI00089B8822|nr:hypothetical protein [Tenacibaculum sp. MAR_2010_89]SED66269.1 hypothetical protein SAMN04487765_0647 [Tenacibaculum sp. MAR_2010_89]
MNNNHIRYLSQNHILFKEAIIAFSKERAEKASTLVKLYKTTADKRIYGYLVLDFSLSEDIVCGDLTIFKSEKIDFDLKDTFGQQISWTYISAVRMPEYVNFLNSSLYTLALSSICSFAFERPVYSATEYTYEKHLEKKASLEELKHIGMSFPILSLGNDGTESRVHSSIISQWIKNFKEIYKVVNTFSETDNSNSKLTFYSFFQIMRLVQLSLQNKKNDFDLSFSLLIAAIESAATFYSMPISPTKPKEHKQWLKLRKSGDPIINNLANKYEELWAKFSQVEKDSQLSSRFIKFIFECAPKETWEETIDNDLLRDGINYRQKYPHEVSLQSELTPFTLSDEQLEEVIKKTYSYRSNFFHKGISTPHQEHKNSNRNRFFEKTLNMSRYNKKKKETHLNIESLYNLHAKYELMSCIARVSITENAKRTTTKPKLP